MTQPTTGDGRLDNEVDKAADALRGHTHGTAPERTYRGLNWRKVGYASLLAAAIGGALFGASRYFPRSEVSSQPESGYANNSNGPNSDGSVGHGADEQTQLPKEPNQPETDEHDQPVLPLREPVLPEQVPASQPEPAQAGPAPDQPNRYGQENPQQPPRTFRDKLVQIRERYAENGQGVAERFYLGEDGQSGVHLKLRKAREQLETDALEQLEEILTPERREYLEKATKKVEENLGQQGGN